MADILAFFSIENAWFTLWSYPVSYLEAIGTLFGVVSVYLAARANIHTWSTGIVNVLLFVSIYYQVQLYADMLLQIYFLVMSVYGWLVWHKRKTGVPGNIISLGVKKQVCLYLAIAGGAIGLGLLIDNLHNFLPVWFSQPAAFPLADALTTVLSIFATILLARKIMQSWILWIMVDLISVTLYWQRGIYLVALEYVLFLIIATAGFLQWRKIYDNEQRIGDREIYATAPGASVPD